VLGSPVAVVMEGYNGHACPLDWNPKKRIQAPNNLKLARFREIFPGPAKLNRPGIAGGLVS